VNLKEALAHANSVLRESGIEDASLEGEILLRYVLGISRAQLYADLNTELSSEQEKTLEKLLERRRRGEPSAYITGHREFYGLDFRVDRSVLIPRPETELLIELAIKIARKSAITEIADVGTGCGAIAISLAAHLPQVTVYATDISPEALEVARFNCKRHNVADRVVLRRGDLLGPLDGPVDMIVANLPYVREHDLIKNAPLSYEPGLALNGGSTGLEKIRSLIRQMAKKLNRGGYLILEIGEGQVRAVKAILRKEFPEAAIEVHKDLAGIERAISLRLT
jgi:release factor glutamine methyltransferase